MKAPAVAVLVQAWVSILFPLALISFQFFTPQLWLLSVLKIDAHSIPLPIQVGWMGLIPAQLCRIAFLLCYNCFSCLKNLPMISLFLDFSFIWRLAIMEWALTEVPGNLITSIQDTTGMLFWFLYSLFCFFVANLFSFFLLGLSVDVVAAKIEPRLANTLIR